MVTRRVNGRRDPVQARARICKEAMPQACLVEHTACVHASGRPSRCIYVQMCWQAQELPDTLHWLMCTLVEAPTGTQTL